MADGEPGDPAIPRSGDPATGRSGDPTIPRSGDPAIPRSPCGACASRRTSFYARAKDVEYFTTDASFDYLRCADCGTITLADPPVHDLARIYPANYYSFQPASQSLAQRVKDSLDRRLFRSCLRELPARPLAVMDVGGGQGYQLTLLRALDPRVKTSVVVDLDAAAASVAESQGHQYFHGRIEDYRPDVRFDLILALNLIEHVANPGEVLARLRACLSPEGMLIVKTPNVSSWDQRLFRHRNWGGFHCPRHWVLFSKESFLGLASRCGLGPSRFAFTQGAPFWAVSVLAALNDRNLIRIDAGRPAVTHPLYTLLILVFAAFDFLRRPFFRTSQMFVVLKKSADR